MAIELEGRVSIPPNMEAVAFSAPAEEALSEGDVAWRGLLRLAADALIRFQVASGAEVAALFCLRTGRAADGGAIPLVTLMFVFPSETPSAHHAALFEALDGSGWTADGVQEIPDSAFPALAYDPDGLVQVWLSSPSGVVAPRLVLRDDGVGIANVRLEDADPADFPATARHARVVPGDRKRQAIPEKDRLKAAYAWQVCQDIIHADEEITDTELAFVRRTFNERMLRSLDLLDEEGREEARRQALVELPHLMERDEKLALVGLFYRVAQADGFVDPRELDVIAEAGAGLGLSYDDVQKYLQQIW